MYPKHFLDYFRDFKTEDEVFVAMPFEGEAAQRRWKEVFRPAIKEVDLEPFRVDDRPVADSILTDILDHVGRARLILGDLSEQVIGYGENGPVRRPNPNVLYELGIAHARRLPEEVVVVRDQREVEGEDDGPPFDLAHIRYQAFDSANTEEATESVAEYLSGALREIDRTRDQIVEKTLKVIDDESAHLILDNYESGYFNPWIGPEEAGDAGPSYQRFVVPRLLDLGVLRAETYQEYGTRKYYFTELGEIVGEELPDRAGFIAED